MLKDVPIIPTTESVDWFQYNTTDIEGWPTQGQPVRAAGGVQRAGRRAGAAAPVQPEPLRTSRRSRSQGDVHEGEHEELVAVRYLARRLGFFVLTLWAALT